MTITIIPGIVRDAPRLRQAWSRVVWRTAWITMGLLTEPITVMGWLCCSFRDHTDLRRRNQAVGLQEFSELIL